MHPLFIEIFGRPVYWFGVLCALGFLAAVANWTVLARHDEREPGFASELGCWAMFGGLVGARMAYVMAHLKEYLADPIQILRFDQGGLIFYGGVLGGFLGILLFARRKKLPLLAVGDYTLTGLVIGHVMGRIGCFLNGCCFGSPTSGPLGVQFPGGSPACYQQVHEGLLSHPSLSSLSVHPVQLYESFFNLLLYAFLFFLYKRRRFNGQVAALYLILYPTARFLLEFLRGDSRLQWLHWNVAQQLSLFFILCGAGLYVFCKRRGEEPLHGNASS